MEGNNKFLIKIFICFFVILCLVSMFLPLHSCTGEACCICCTIDFFRNIYILLGNIFLIFILKKILENSFSNIGYTWQIGYSLNPVKLKVKMSE